MMPKDSGMLPIRLFRLLASEPALNEAMEPLGRHLIAMGTQRDSALTQRDRELVILRTCARRGCEYQWGIHAQLHAPMAGLSAAEIKATTVVGASRTMWSERDQLILDLVDELSNIDNISDVLWNRLRAFWKQSDLLLLIASVGWYHLISFIANTAQLEPETGATRFPACTVETPAHETEGAHA
jgi:alkylhydroperoxidase/carboxymuconolactone decarboxylase family protein YurZ